MTEQQNLTDKDSVFSAIDLVPTLLTLTETPFPKQVTFDGEALVPTLLGQGGSRKQPLFFRRPPDRDAFYGESDLPDLAVRAGRWKLLCEYDGTETQLYDLETDRTESKNVATQHPEITKRLTEQLLKWHQTMPPDNGATYRAARHRKKAKTGN